MIARTMTYWVYMTASMKRGTIYTGITSDLPKRATEHREGTLPGFTRRHGVKRLVYYETFEDVRAAIAREKLLKHWLRAWKIALIEKTNPEWFDLWPEIMGLRDPSLGKGPICD